MADILPAVFFGHGNPMNALMSNVYTDAWRRIGEDARGTRRVSRPPSRRTRSS